MQWPEAFLCCHPCEAGRLLSIAVPAPWGPQGGSERLSNKRSEQEEGRRMAIWISQTNNGLHIQKSVLFLPFPSPTRLPKERRHLP